MVLRGMFIYVWQKASFVGELHVRIMSSSQILEMSSLSDGLESTF